MMMETMVMIVLPEEYSLPSDPQSASYLQLD
jgi:hypothetical protein